MPVLDRQAVPDRGAAAPRPQGGVRHLPDPATLPPSLRDLPPRSVPETDPTPLQRHYINLSVIALICGAVAITALELGSGLGSPLVKLCVIVGSADPRRHDRRRDTPHLAVGLGLDAGRAGKGLFRLCWVAVRVVLLALLAFATAVVLLA